MIEMCKNVTEPGEDSQEVKHINLHRAIRDVASLSERLDKLISRLEGPFPAETVGKEAKPNIPTFMEVLNHGHAELRTLTDDAHKRIEQLNEMLF